MPDGVIGALMNENGTIDASTHFLITMQIQDGEFEYTDRYIHFFDSVQTLEEAWVKIVEEELHYLDFNNKEEGEAEDYNGRHFNVDIQHIVPQHEPILRRYLY